MWCCKCCLADFIWKVAKWIISKEGLIMRKNLKGLFVLSVMCFCLLAGGTTIYAQKVNETESNDTKETAQLIQANKETAAGIVNGNYPDQYVVKGYTSTTDDDWYKVYLTSGTQYVTCNDNGFSFEVYDPAGNRITRQSYEKTGFGVKAYPFSAESEGYYYVKVTGAVPSSESYLLLVGGPTYMVAKCEVKLQPVTMANNTDKVIDFDITKENQLPENAIVYSISMNGIGSNSVDGISLTNTITNKTVDLRRYSWNQSKLESMNLILKSSWIVELAYYKDTSFTPSVDLRYAYPVVSECVEDNIVVTR